MNSAKVELKQLNEMHLAQTLTWLSNKELRRQIDSLSPPNPEKHFEVWKKRFVDPTRVDFAIFWQGEHVGNCGLMHLDPIRKKAELWIYIGESRSQGVGRQALQLLLEHGFGPLALNRIHLRVLLSNPGAVRFYEKFGFFREGLARADSVQDGEYIDAVLMSLLRSEFSK